ncbi:Pumilio-like protein 3 [Picochlorum sp. SENEW3]|nr:Pumilio-like protein 3 [Picochlorum sp. SENEW3]
MDPSNHREKGVEEYEETGTYYIQYYHQAMPVMVSGGPVYSGSPHEIYGAMYSSYPPMGYVMEQGQGGSGGMRGASGRDRGSHGGRSNNKGMRGVSGRSHGGGSNNKGMRGAPSVSSSGKSSMPSSRSSASAVDVRQQSKPDKSAIASMIGLCVSDEAFRTREKEFQIPVYESVSMEAAHEEYVSKGRGTVSSGEIDVMSNGDVSAMDPDIVRRVAFDHEGSKALQAIILSHGNTPAPSIWARSSSHRGMPPHDDKDDDDYQAIDRIYQMLSKDIMYLCLDMYGNYTVQCLLMEASPKVAQQLGAVIVANVLQFSLNFYGCRVVQCAMKHLSMDYRSKMCDALEPFALHCLQSQNANHVINALMTLPRQDRPSHVGRMHASICEYAVVLATHKYGVTVLKTALESDISRNLSKAATRRLLDVVGELAYDEYGNYLVQNLIQANMWGVRRAVHEFLVQCPLLTLACDKFGSNVFETFLLNSNAEQSDAVIIAFLEQCRTAGNIDQIVVNIAINRYGNYVVQRMLMMSSIRVRQMLSRHLAPYRAMLMGSKHGRHIAKQLLLDM